MKITPINHGSILYESLLLLNILVGICFLSHLEIIYNWRRLIGGVEGNLRFEVYRDRDMGWAEDKRVKGLQNMRSRYDGTALYHGYDFCREVESTDETTDE